jgi:CheY-like chemotaxis protein
MGGELYLVESEVGKGSTFEFYIPVASSHFNNEDDSQALTALKKEKIEHLEGTLQKVSVLIVEDGVDNQILFKNILELAGATVKVIDNGLDAFEDAKDNDYDVILMDIQLPDMEGKDVTRKLRHFGYKGPIIGITAHAFEEDKQLALEAGLDDYKTKPIPAEQLIKLVHDWIHKKQS